MEWPNQPPRKGLVVQHKFTKSIEVVDSIDPDQMRGVSLSLIDSPLGHWVDLDEYYENYEMASEMAQVLYGFNQG